MIELLKNKKINKMPNFVFLKFLASKNAFYTKKVDAENDDNDNKQRTFSVPLYTIILTYSFI